MPFLDELTFRVAAGTETSIVLTAELRYRDSFGRLYTVPVGFVSDLASVPVWVRWLPGVTKWNVSARPGVWHDACYRWNELWRVPRAEADHLYMRALMEEGVSMWRAEIQRLALRLAGGGTWERWRHTSERRKGPTPPQRVPPPTSRA